MSTGTATPGIRELIERKRDGGELAPAEIDAFARGVAAGTVPDYQAAAMLMAIFLRGMNPAETSALARAMVESGARLDWRGRPGVRVDKHSTGGVGDKISLALAPAVAACGGQVPMISGRSLGHTGGTLDKLESIPGFRTALSEDEIVRQVGELGVAFGAATASIAPADRVLYRLRDATATVESLPLITASIVSKKVAEGINALVLDVKTGDGAFLPDPRVARALAESMVRVAGSLGVQTVALLTDMSQPLGRAVGNALETEEAIAVLRGAGPPDVVELTVALGAEMLVLSRLVADRDAGRSRIARALADGSALARFRAAIERQGGDPRACDDGSRVLPRAAHASDVAARSAGFVRSIRCRVLGVVATRLGAGRERVEDRIDPAVGLVVHRRIGDRIAAGEPLVTVHANDRDHAAAARATLESAFEIGPEPVRAPPLIADRIDSAAPAQCTGGSR